MSYGLRVTNPDSKTIISDATINPIYRGKASLVSQVAPSSSYSGNGFLDFGVGVYKLVFFAPWEEEPIAFLHSATTYYMSLYSAQKVSGGWYLYVYTFHPQSTVQVSVRVFTRIPPGTVVNSGYGMNIWKGNGDLAFSTPLNQMAPTVSQRASTPYFTASPNATAPSGVPMFLGTGNNTGYNSNVGTVTVSGIPQSTALNFTFSRSAGVYFGRDLSPWYGRLKIDRMLDHWTLFFAVANGYAYITWGLVTRHEYSDDAGYWAAAPMSMGGGAGPIQPSPMQWDYVLGVDTAHYD